MSPSHFPATSENTRFSRNESGLLVDYFHYTCIMNVILRGTLYWCISALNPLKMKNKMLLFKQMTAQYFQKRVAQANFHLYPHV